MELSKGQVVVNLFPIYRIVITINYVIQMHTNNREEFINMSQASTPKETPIFTSIGVIFRPVEDVEKAREFYGSTLGLKQLWKAPDGATAYSTGEGPIIIVNGKSDNIESEVQFNIGAEDISQAYRSMKARGVDVGKIKIVGETSMFFFKDPAENVMMVWACHLPNQDLPQYYGD